MKATCRGKFKAWKCGKKLIDSSPLFTKMILQSLTNLGAWGRILCYKDGMKVTWNWRMVNLKCLRIPNWACSSTQTCIRVTNFGF